MQPFSLNCPSVGSLQFRDKNVVQNSAKCLAQVQTEYISFSSHSHQHCNPVLGGSGIVNIRLLLPVYRGSHPLDLPGHVACSRPSLLSSGFALCLILTLRFLVSSLYISRKISIHFNWSLKCMIYSFHQLYL